MCPNPTDRRDKVGHRKIKDKLSINSADVQKNINTTAVNKRQNSIDRKKETVNTNKIYLQRNI